MLTFLFFVALTLYCLSLLLFAWGLFRETTPESKEQPFITIVIPAKNEKDSIESILYDVTHQTYPNNKYEIIVVDDESTDITPNICRAFADRYPNIKLLSTRGTCSHLRYKKRPLDIGIRQAKGEIILLTDADCHVASTWIEVIVSYFSPDVGLVIGYSETSPAYTTLQKIEALDFLMLMTAARGTALLGFPFACSGRNLAYRKETFEAVGGFAAFADAVGGDDALLLQQIKHKTDYQMVFATHRGSFVSTSPLSTPREMVSQRIRWAADTLSIRYTDPLFFGIITTTFLANLTPLLMAVAIPAYPGLLLPLLKGLLVKFVAEGLIMMRGTRLFRRTELRGTFPLWFISQIPYVVIMGLMSFVGNRLSWGGRFK